MAIRNLEPKALWNHFTDLNAVPRPSKKEERVIAFMEDFGKSLQLETTTDKIGNVIIKKPASPGMEDRKTVILQSHLDMVHQKNATTRFDFEQEGIQMLVDGDWVKAAGTTLGADNGIGVAAIMALLASRDIAHPPLEAFFTIDEETGMTGAKQMDGSLLQGEILLNLDTEDDDELSVGCAGGIDTNTRYSYTEIELPAEFACFQIAIKGLMGGHSGMDIDKGRGNANKLLARILFELSKELHFKLVEFDGGGLRNAIPREAHASLAIDHEFEGQLEIAFSASKKHIEDEFSRIEGALQIALTPAPHVYACVNHSDQEKMIAVLHAVHNGVFRMSPDIEGLVEASSSLARVLIRGGEFTTQSLQRSSVESSKTDVADTIRTAFELIGAEVVQGGEYPGWQPNPNSEILKIMTQLYQSEFNEAPQVKACHAGLECGILLQHLPKVDMISFGPNIRGAHSPDEKVQISSVQKFWSYLQKVLLQIPKNA